METLLVQSSNSYLDGRRLGLYTPPSLQENPKPVYDVIFVPDIGPPDLAGEVWL